jgi:hypothetical protein
MACYTSNNNLKVTEKTPTFDYDRTWRRSFQQRAYLTKIIPATCLPDEGHSSDVPTWRRSFQQRTYLTKVIPATCLPDEGHSSNVSTWQTLSHNVVSSTPRHELTTLVVIGTDCTFSCKSNYHTITATTTPPGHTLTNRNVTTPHIVFMSLHYCKKSFTQTAVRGVTGASEYHH